MNIPISLSAARVPSSFREDIEGLRGIAVLFVVLFHFELFGFKGGFIGVDLFFVLSGFLMTKILFSSKFNWSPSGIVAYYLKRFWRIAPAYYFVFVAIVALYYLLPWGMDLRAFQKSAIAASALSYNIHAPSDSGYFATDAILNPLQHLWSLGAEVQFYLVWPLILFFLRSRPVRYKALALASAAAVSLIACQILVFKDPEVAYFSILTRLWQFAVGGICAIIVAEKKSLQSDRLANSVCSVSLAVLFVCALTLGDEHWPSLTALVPVIALSCLLIFGAQNTSFAGMVLSSAPLRYLGKISYSLYLVHWPTVVFTNLAQDNFLNSIEIRSIAALVSIGLAHILFISIEAPLRVKGLHLDRLAKKCIPIFALAFFPFATACLVFSPPVLQMIPNGAKITQDQNEYYSFEEEHCKDGKTPAACNIGDTKFKPSLIIWGDSHGRAAEIGLHSLLKSKSLSAIAVTKSACPPMIGHRDLNTECAKFYKSMVEPYLLKPESPQKVLIVSRWMQMLSEEELTGKGFLTFEELGKQYSDLPRPYNYLEKTLDMLRAQGKQVILATQPPELGSSTRFTQCRRAFMRQWEEDLEACNVSQSDNINKQFEIDKNLKILAERYDNVTLFDLKQAFCTNGVCTLASKDTLYLNDDDHLSPSGARYAFKSFVDQL
ncbi:acyltransferase family protein [Polycladidibacter hongkongensis]|uniref:acyltransferase family protein n=1 Tax=Polycladidibacter hongkongensis TaxID=1647556 RepID=UPI000831B6C0|nr:acyltransferase family protein [Pseudovibrio hongkongensis]